MLVEKLVTIFVENSTRVEKLKMRTAVSATCGRKVCCQAEKKAVNTTELKSTYVF